MLLIRSLKQRLNEWNPSFEIYIFFHFRAWRSEIRVVDIAIGFQKAFKLINIYVWRWACRLSNLLANRLSLSSVLLGVAKCTFIMQPKYRRGLKENDEISLASVWPGTGIHGTITDVRCHFVKDNYWTCMIHGTEIHSTGRFKQICKFLMWNRKPVILFKIIISAKLSFREIRE